jgi:hypothetical protein
MQPANGEQASTAQAESGIDPQPTAPAPQNNPGHEQPAGQDTNKPPVGE